MAKAKKLVCEQRGQVEIQVIEVGSPGEKEIQISTVATTISSGTERATIIGLPHTAWAKCPFVPGYCTAGIVNTVGSGVEGFFPGDRIMTNAVGHQSLANVPANRVHKIPDGVDFDVASMMVLGQIALQGVRKAHVEIGEKAMVLGLGIIGRLALEFIKMSGACPVVGADKHVTRLRLAKEAGIDIVVDTSKDNWMEEMEGLPAVVIDATGYPDAVSVALESAGSMGRVVMLGSTRGESTVDFYDGVHSKGVIIYGAHASRSVPQVNSYPGFWTPWDDTECCLNLLAKGKLKVDHFITDRVNFDNCLDVYNKMLNWNYDMLGIIIDWN